jgi:GTPase SAR1 family protein
MRLGRYLFKILIIGDDVRSIRRHLLPGIIGANNSGISMNIGVEFFVYNLDIIAQGEPHEIVCQIWELQNDDRFQPMRESFYLGAKGAIVYFDLDSEDSFKTVPQWIAEIHNFISDLPTLLIGLSNSESNRVISIEEANNFAKMLNIPYIETDLLSVKNIFQILGYLITGIEYPPDLGEIIHIYSSSNPFKIAIKLSDGKNLTESEINFLCSYGGFKEREILELKFEPDNEVINRISERLSLSTELGFNLLL